MKMEKPDVRQENFRELRLALELYWNRLLRTPSSGLGGRGRRGFMGLRGGVSGRYRSEAWDEDEWHFQEGVEERPPAIWNCTLVVLDVGEEGPDAGSVPVRRGVLAQSFGDDVGQLLLGPAASLP